MRGGLDDALDKLARRDELRRRAAGEATGTPPAVTELVEAIAAVVAHNPQLGVTVGVEGAGEPLLLHFYFGDGQVQVNAENAVAARPDDPEPVAPRHADFDVEAEEAYSPADQPSPDDQDRFDQASFGYAQGAAEDQYYAESDTAERRYGSFDAPPDPRYADMRPGESSRDLGARMRDLGMASTQSEPEYPPHPFAPTPRPEVPPQTGPTQPPYAQPTPTHPTSAQPMSAQPMSAQPMSAQPMSAQPMSAQPMSAQPMSAQPMSAQPMSGQPAHGMPPQPRPPVPPRSEHSHAEPDSAEPTRRLQRDRIRPPAGHTTERIPHQARPQEQRTGMPSPLPKPIPLKVERPEETELAARRLAALLRDDPSLLNQPPD